MVSPPAVAAVLRCWRLAILRFSPTPARADNRLHPEGGAMPRLDDTAIEEGLQHLPGWERRGNQIVKAFVRADFAQAMVFVNGRCRGRGGRSPPSRHRHPLEQGHPGPVQPRRGRANRPRLPARRPHPGAPTARPARLMVRLARSGGPPVTALASAAWKRGPHDFLQCLDDSLRVGPRGWPALAQVRPGPRLGHRDHAAHSRGY